MRSTLMSHMIIKSPQIIHRYCIRWFSVHIFEKRGKLQDLRH